MTPEAELRALSHAAKQLLLDRVLNPVMAISGRSQLRIEQLRIQGITSEDFPVIRIECDRLTRQLKEALGLR